MGGGGVAEHVEGAELCEQVRGSAGAVDRGDLRALGGVG